LRDRTGREGVSAAWLCREGACKLPATTVSELEQRLAEMAAEINRTTSAAPVQ
jgi:hypothetical protein